MNQATHNTTHQNHPFLWTSPPSSFTGKERDEETGYGYFGARYMDYELTTMWLSVDPMSDKYPSISPYAYCAWNPVKLVDPDGREIGDYYNTNGEYLGWDGKYDDNVYIIENGSDQRKIKNNKTTSLEELASAPAVSTTYTALKAAINVYQRSHSKGNEGQYEESSLVDGRITHKGKRGTHNSAILPDPGYEVSYEAGISIHSHPDDNSAEYPGPDDPAVFSRYHQNIIVGPIRKKNTSDKSVMVKGNIQQEAGLAFYPSSIARGDQPQRTISLRIANKIVSQQSHWFIEHTIGL